MSASRSLHACARSASLRSVAPVLFALSVATGAAADDASIMKGLRAAFTTPAEAMGDRAAAVSAWIDALEADPASPAAIVLLARIAQQDDLDVVPRRAATVFERLLRSKSAISPVTRAALVDRLARQYRTDGEFGRAEALERDLDYVRNWCSIGPFGYTSASVHAIAFSPERELDMDRPHPSGWRTVRWRPVVSVGSGRDVDLFAPLWPREGCAYALAQFQAPTMVEAFLELRCVGSHKVWLNDHPVADVNRGMQYRPLREVYPVLVGKGWNRILLKVAAADATVSCRLYDAAGLRIPGLEWEVGTAQHSVDTPPRAAIHAAPATPQDEFGAFLIRSGARAPEDEALVRIAMGVLACADGMHERAVAELDRAVALRPGLPHAWYQLALACELAEVLPESLRRNRARDAHQRASRCDGGFIPADEASARDLHADRKPELAIARLRAAAQANPDNVGAYLLMAEIALDEGWMHEARSWAQDAETVAPQCRRVHLLWSRYHLAQKDAQRAAVALRQALARDESDIASRVSYAKMLLGRGEDAAALAQLRMGLEADPSRLSAYHTFARMQLDLARPVEALTTLRAALRLSDRDPDLHRAVGEAHLRLGEIEAASQAWATALEIRPGWHQLRYQLAELNNESCDFSESFAVDVGKAIAASKSPTDSPGVDAILVVDQTIARVYEDGSYAEITHQAKKALSTSGAEELSHVEIDGELLDARTHTPDGRILEPAVLPGRSTLTMPGVRVGSVIEYRFRRNHAAPPGGFLTLPPWYFRSLKVPHQLSDYVVIAPHDMNLSITKRHWERRFPEESFEEFAPAHGAGTITYRWIARDARQIQPETNHDHVSTILPNIEIGRGRTWHDLNAEMLDMFLGRFRQTEAIGAEAADAVAGADDVEAKARAVFRHVNALVKSDAPVYDANKILHAKAGNRGVLLAAMLQAAGIDARFAVARPRAEAIAPSEGPGEPTWALPSAAYFADTFVCVLTGDGERIWLDPEGPYSAFNVLPARYHGGVALILDDDGGTLTTLPWGPLREQGHTTKTSISFDVAANTAVGSRTLVVSGAAAGTYKRLFAESSSHWRDTWAENALSTAVAGARLTSVQAYGLDDPAEPFSVTSVFDLADALTGTAPDREVPTGLERLHLTKRFVGEPARVYPLKISSPLVAWDEISLKTDVSSVWVCPPPLTEHTAFGSYSLTSVSRGAAVDIKRSIALVPQVIDPARYEEFVRFCRRIDAAETASLRIRPAAPAGK